MPSQQGSRALAEVAPAALAAAPAFEPLSDAYVAAYQWWATALCGLGWQCCCLAADHVPTATLQLHAACASGQ